MSQIEEHGDCAFASADDANIPVSIFLTELQEGEHTECSLDHKWRLAADNYMPRNGRCGQDAYEATARTREELVDLLKQYVLPLYQNAMTKLQAMIEGNNDSLYYWDELE